MEILSMVLILLGLFFLVVAAIGVVRLPDVFSRSHAVSLTDSLGAFLLLTGLALHEGSTVNFFKILAVLALLYLQNPVISHATLRAAVRAGLKPWDGEKR
ncbi:monovalent cation/H(+) antiporter subunit G [Candidatus Nitronereus thalassa]|uniref:Monovalent cation/H(+) antiporter subunit G n=1 Tax=Candidatus Nitronereus thalassa TaxID=3020898 RepID=A0ABU3KAE2_9BACT|nr:monovalent cation/H(+) antiporter subunit G [Candidatus Nitronereus thalassa]MDT7043381.1 monovalent cation/H(+) antiporter subunit G [Candidatus Nitronereus thalassa]